MPLIFTAVARIRDGQTLQKLSSEAFMAQANAVQATRYQVYRNVNDSSRIMVLVEASDQDAVLDIGDRVLEQLDDFLAGNLADDGVWEPVCNEGSAGGKYRGSSRVG